MTVPPLRILLVEDDEVDRMAFLRFVKDEGLSYSAEVAASVAQARKFLASGTFEIILLDHQLSDGTGFDLLEDIRKTPVIFITGTDSPETAVKAMKLGASDYLLKGHDRRYLRLLPLAVERALKQRKAEQDQAELQTMLHRSQKLEALGTLAGGIAHEFNNLLAIMLSNVELAKLRPPQSSELWANLDETLKAGQRAKNMIQQILAFSRKREESREHIVLESTVREVLQLLRTTIPSSVAIVEKFMFHSSTVLANRTEVQQAIINVCNNSWQAMPGSRGRIEICESRVEIGPDFVTRHPDLRPGSYVRLSILDDGMGMETATLARVLDPFFTTKAPGKGSGLGMSVVHGIMKAHEGSVTVESELGVGTTVHLYFPISDAPKSKRPKTDATPIPGMRKRRIMLIEDEPALLRVATIVLERLGFEAASYECPEAAIAAFQQPDQNFDLVITDFNMPGMNGLSVCELMRNIRPDVPLIILTGHNNEALAGRVGIHQNIEIVLKPASFRQLSEAIQRALGNDPKQSHFS